MARTERQEIIAGWDQQRLAQATVAVCGRDWIGAYAVWGLCCLGIGRVVWLGEPCSSAEPMARWLLSEPAPFEETEIYEYPTEVDYAAKLAWAAGDGPLDAMLICSPRPLERVLCWAYGEKAGVFCAGGTTARGGLIMYRPAAHREPDGQHPIPAMAVAAQLVDAVRERICPLANGCFPPEKPMGLEADTRPSKRPRVLQVGVGGIGVFSACLFAALGLRVHLVDFDQVEESNRNRQGLFTAFDSEKGVYKSKAAQHVLSRLFPEARVTAEVRRVGLEYSESVANMAPKPHVLVSAVDNAESRLALQECGRRVKVPVVQGGTATFAADCVTQTLGGPSLDEQLHGALSEAARREQKRRRRDGHCTDDPSYVVPGMMAGALVAYRALQAAEGSQPSPIRWRSGATVVEERRDEHVVDYAELIV